MLLTYSIAPRRRRPCVSTGRALRRLLRELAGIYRQRSEQGRGVPLEEWVQEEFAFPRTDRHQQQHQTADQGSGKAEAKTTTTPTKARAAATAAAAAAGGGGGGGAAAVGANKERKKFPPRVREAIFREKLQAACEEILTKFLFEANRSAAGMGVSRGLSLPSVPPTPPTHFSCIQSTTYFEVVFLFRQSVFICSRQSTQQLTN